MKIIANQKVNSKCCEWKPPVNLSITTKGMLDSVLKTATPSLLATMVESVTVTCPNCGVTHAYNSLDICK